MTKIELTMVIESHKIWLNGEVDGKRADLSGANLRGADLNSANLLGADLRGANLRGADLSGADLRDANLSGAYLRGAYLCDTDLRGADLSGAYLSGAYLSGAYLSGADLSGADLRGTVLDPIRRPNDATQAILAAGIPIIDGIAYGWRTANSKHVGRATYTAGRYTAPVFSVCTSTECHPGIYFASRNWLTAHYPGDRVVPCATWVSCVVASGGKYRTKELCVFDEADERWGV